MAAQLGIDVSKTTLEVVLQADGKRVQAGQFENSRAGFMRLRQVLKKRILTEVHVCLEATDHYGDAVALFFHQAGYRVSVVNPLRIKGYTESRLSRNKTDSSAAALIADFCQTQQPEAWTPPSPAYQELQALERHLEHLHHVRQQAWNRRQAGIPSSSVEQMLDAHLAFLDQQIGNVQQRIRQHIEHCPELCQQQRLLMSIPGIGQLTAAKLLAEIRDIRAFETARQLAAFAGLSPSQHQSSTSVRGRTRLSKRGNARIRKALYFPAIVAQQHNPILHYFALRLRQAGKAKLAVIAAVMRKLLHLVYGILKSGQPFDPHYLTKHPAFA